VDKAAYHLALRSAFASHYAFVIKAQDYHWNTVGRMFYQDHLLFERIYTEAYGVVDDFAENLRSVNVIVPAGLSQLSKLSAIKDAPDVPPAADEMIAYLYNDSLSMVSALKGLYAAAEEQGDHGLSNFFADQQTAFAKHAWMLGAVRRARA
jgi:starvation-inducible DNA-binding protein